MKYFSLFSGIGGFELGIQKAYIECKYISKEPESKECTQRGKRFADKRQKEFCTSDRKPPLCVGYSEIDKYAIQVYKKHFPKHQNYGDATKINTQKIPNFNFLVAGFPCQAFSIAGKRRGFNDTRGTLFFEIARILRDKRPKHFLLENVKGLLSHDEGETFQTILRVLSDLGYNIEWQVLNSKNFGVPQNRERVFIIGYFGEGSRRKVFPIGETTEASLEYTGGIEGRLEGKTGLYAMRGRGESNKQVLEKRKDGSTNTVTSVQKDNLFIDLSTQKAKLTREARALQARYNKGYSHRKAETSGVYDNFRIRRLTPIECERLQGFPDDWTKYGINTEGRKVEISDTQRYKCLGNAVTVNVIEYLIPRLNI